MTPARETSPPLDAAGSSAGPGGSFGMAPERAARRGPAPARTACRRRRCKRSTPAGLPMPAAALRRGAHACSTLRQPCSAPGHGSLGRVGRPAPSAV